MIGKVYLVGAGPGDPELITLKGMRLLQQADVIIYDRLINPQLLPFAKKSAKLIYCGKSPHNHAMKQEAINELLVNMAKKGKRIVRLKGGDPFVFGRGGEEALACVKNNIPFEVVPGITAGIGASAYGGIPVTHRGVSRSVTFITGHKADDEGAEQQWGHLAKGADTLCIYMGVTQLNHIIQSLIEHGRAPQTPIALIHWGTYLEQKVVTGTLDTIIDKISEEKIANPSMIVIGEVVTLSEELEWFQKEMVPPLSVAHG